MSIEQQDMKRSLKPRHIMMMTLGGTIGSGIFKGSSSSIALAGPGVIVPYLIAGLVLFIVMKSMAELVVANPKAKNLCDLIEPSLGRFIGYWVGWIYWLSWVLVMAAEMAAAASFLQYWLPNISLWILSLILSIIMTTLNLFQVRVYGETEYWLAGVKIATLTVFVVLGAILIFAKHTHDAAHNLVGQGGFFPHGLTGLFSAMLVVMFSFGGVETVGMTLGETTNPEKTIPKAVRAVMARILMFYIFPILIIVSLVPWNTLGTTQSPFVSVFEESGIPFVGNIMNFVLLTAVLSAVNTGMYATSRLLYAQATLGNAPKFFAKLTTSKTPTRALLFSSLFLYVGVIIAFFAKGNTFDYLMVLPGYIVMIVWALLTLGRMKSRGVSPSTLISFCAIIAIYIGVVVTSPPLGTLMTLVALGIIGATYWLRKRNIR